MRTPPTAGVVVASLLVLAGCGAGGAEEDRRLTVFAAASLTTAFEEIADEFEASHPEVDVELVLGGSSDLVAQITEGAPADVFASADEATMANLVSAGLAATEPRPFATNTLRIAVPPGNPAGVEELADLARPGLRLVVCAPEVPCGAATREVAARAGVGLSPVSEEQSVTDVLGKVTSGEADAGVVYRTDVRAAGDAVAGISFPESSSVVNLYPVATVAGSEEPDLAQQFVDLVAGETGQSILRRAGFGSAP